MQYITFGSSIVAAIALYWSFGKPNSSKLTQQLQPREKLSKNKSKKAKFNELSALMEIPDFSSLLWFAVSAGESLDTALKIAVSRSSGYVSTEFQLVLKNVEHGALLQVELQNLAVEAKSEQVRELATKLAVALNNGSALSDLLSDFVQSATTELRTQLRAKAGKNETKMMIPMVFVILPVTVMFALYPSLALIQGSFL
jgi:tight adherence protein C